MADTDHPTTETDETQGTGVPAGTPQPAEAEATGMPVTPDEGAPAEDAEQPAEDAEQPAEDAEQPAEDAEQPAPADEPDADEAEESAASRFGAQFSSPEPTAVVARPRRRATRPAGAAAPDPAEAAPPAPAAPVPAFISFMAPPVDAPPAPRRRSRRPAESPDPEVLEERSADRDSADETTDEAPRSRRSRSRRRSAEEQPAPVEDVAEDEPTEDTDDSDESGEDSDGNGSSASRRRRRGRRGRGRGRSGEDSADADDEDAPERAGAESDDDEDTDTADEPSDSEDENEDEGSTGSGTRRRRRRRRRSGSSGAEDSSDDTDDDDRPERAGRNGRSTSDDDVRGIAGSTRLEAKRQRRRDGRDTGRRRQPILTESEFLARREAVDRKMVIRQRGERTQIAVLEDDVLVEHYVTQAQATSFAGNVYLGRVQNVLPSMEAAFVDIGKGRNAVVYAGEVNWDAAGLSGKQRSIEQAFKSGDKILVQVTKDPIGHKGARLTQQINLPGRFLVYVPGGSMTGISRKLPDTERQRLKDLLKRIVPDDAGVIIRTAAEGASEEELTRDVNRLKAQWDVIKQKSESTSNAPTLLYGEPDLAIRVIRDVFNEDFKELVVQGDDAWDTVEAYVAHVSPELTERLARYTGQGDVFHDLRIDEQLTKALDRKVWLPSGGSLVIDRTEAMTVVDVNTGKFTGSGGNLEQTVTRNNMEAAEEIVRQLRLRDIGGIIVIDFIDMVLESNRDLVLRRLTECLGRDRTKHQVAEVTSLGLVQMTRKRVGQGLLEVFSESCEHCRGRGILVHLDPVDEKRRGGGPGGNAPGNASGGGGGGGKDPGGRDSGNGRNRGGGKDAPAKEAPAPEAPAAEAEETAQPAAAEAPAGNGEATEGGRSGGRRGRGRRNRGQSGEERAAEDAAVLSGARPDEDAPAGEPVADGSAETVEDIAPVAAAASSEPGSSETEPEAPAGTDEAAAMTPAQRLDPPVTMVQPLPETAPVPVPTAELDFDDVLPAGEVGAVEAPEQDAMPITPATTAADVVPGGVAHAADSGAQADGQPPADPSAGDGEPPAAPSRPRRRRAASRPAGPPA
ncbi:Rne/Rng family ribonuclease [Blastococcus sp. VKM Ac-2987]|uniref:Rne/Rng family ribonuclease n=1 Tax=Blastococcus sp. VKM Ac-2987 TaxID=3004141 RepID=UPI0022AB5220|nr:Rne/Rng family ribonuclease [Blastococcus sp. VKM Ac-2987]MCZ2857392.1 Rne/Rng family ribonuclease [Blastococcus sp. VKM Ac-2987]